MEDETAQLVLQLQLEDLEALLRQRNVKGKRRDGDVDDFDLALNSYKADLESMATVAADYKLSLSIARAVQSDGQMIREWKAQEAQATRDRNLALGVRGDENLPVNPETESSGPLNGFRVQDDDDYDEEFIARLAGLYLSPLDNDALGSQPESSSWAASRRAARPSVPRVEKRNCVSCMEQHALPGLMQAPCSHHYCRGCLTELFTRSLTDESLFPPRCCGQPIPARGNPPLLTVRLVREFEAKKIEFETPNRTYCHRPSCATFIPPQFIQNDQAICVRCSSTTCSICKRATHQGDCPEDHSTQELLRFASENGWQRCHSCHRVVELTHGCHHITCRCGAQFCYVCAAPWKTCECPQWYEERLTARAQDLVMREIPEDRPIQPAVFEIMVDQARQALIDDHECDHNSWRRISGPRNCEECGDRMPVWLNVCRQCNIMVCRRCKFNRL